MIRGVDTWLVVVVYDRKDYIKEVEIQVGDEEIFEEVPNDPGPLLHDVI